jgi:hypothetical protein
VQRPGILMMAFGALDLFAFYRCSPKLVKFFETYSGNIFQLLLFLMILSLLASGALLMTGNKIGYKVYFFQLAPRLAYLPSLTFGFLTSILHQQVGTLYWGMLLATMYALEAIRLMHTVQKYRNLQ